MKRSVLLIASMNVIATATVSLIAWIATVTTMAYPTARTDARMTDAVTKVKATGA